MPRASSDFPTPPPRVHSLVLRLWPESREFEGEAPIWRGSLSDLDGSNTRYFDNGCLLCSLIAESTGAEAMACRREQSS